MLQAPCSLKASLTHVQGCPARRQTFVPVPILPQDSPNVNTSYGSWKILKGTLKHSVPWAYTLFSETGKRDYAT